MKALIERLRDGQEIHDGDWSMLDEAADAIETLSKDAERWRAMCKEAERDYVEIAHKDEPWYQRFECTAAMEEWVDKYMKELK